MRFLVIIGLAAASLSAQTRVDLKSQSKNVDFSGATSVRPFPSGTMLPATCSIGGMFFKSDASAGANLYGCVAANTWAVEAGSSGGGGGTGPGFSLPFTIQKNGTALTVGQGCSLMSPCLARIGSVVYSIAAPATATVVSGDGIVFFYLDSSGALSAGTTSASAPSITCSGCQVIAPVTQFPADSIPLGTWNATAGNWDVTGTDTRAMLSAAPRFLAGPNVNLAQTGGQVTISATFTTLATGALPACASATRGVVWYTAGGAGAKDAVQVCAKDALDAYAWRTIY